MSNYVFLKFENAGYFPDSSRSKDFVIDLNGKKKRSEFKQYVEPINVHHVSNMLHVLMGERPVASLRKTIFDVNGEIFNIAKNGWIKITNGQFLNAYKNIMEYPKETMTLRKAMFNSYNASELISWERIKELLEDDLFIEFMAILNQIFAEDVLSKYTSDEAVKIIRERYLDNQLLVEFINNKLKGKMPLINYINGKLPYSFYNNARTANLIGFGCDKVVRLNGEIVVCVNDEYLNRIRNSKGFSKILDGGLVSIIKVEKAEDVFESDLIGFTKIGSISTEIKEFK